MVGKTRAELLEQAADLYERFTGLPADTVQKVDAPNVKAGVLIGEVMEIAYSTVRKHGRDQEAETHYYRHEFKKSARPLFGVSHDGKTLLILLGDFEFTERGITDR